MAESTSSSVPLTNCGTGSTKKCGETKPITEFSLDKWAWQQVLKG